MRVENRKCNLNIQNKNIIIYIFSKRGFDMNKTNKSSISRIFTALLLAVLMILQPIATAAASAKEDQPVLEKIVETENTGEPLEINLEELNTISKPSKLGWIDQGKTGNPIEVLNNTAADLYADSSEVELKRLILQNTIEIDMQMAETSGLKISETDNMYSDRENYKEYEIAVDTNKKASIFPFTFNLSTIKEGSAFIILGKDSEENWVKAEVVYSDSAFVISDKAEGTLLTEGRSLESIIAGEKQASEKVIQEAKAIAEQEALEQKAIEE